MTRFIVMIENSEADSEIRSIWYHNGDFGGWRGHWFDRLIEQRQLATLTVMDLEKWFQEQDLPFRKLDNNLMLKDAILGIDHLTIVKQDKNHLISEVLEMDTYLYSR